MRPVEERLWSRVERRDNGCWEWTGHRAVSGHGQIRVGGAVIGTHRLAWSLAHGEDPGDLYVCHRCDNPPCCNPMHLYAGTAADNSEDAVQRGRASGNPTNGEQHYRTALTLAQVVEMKALRREGWKLRELAERYGMSVPGISAICTGRTWKHYDLQGGRPA